MSTFSRIVFISLAPLFLLSTLGGAQEPDDGNHAAMVVAKVLDKQPAVIHYIPKAKDYDTCINEPAVQIACFTGALDEAVMEATLRVSCCQLRKMGDVARGFAVPECCAGVPDHRAYRAKFDECQREVIHVTNSSNFSETLKMANYHNALEHVRAHCLRIKTEMDVKIMSDAMRITNSVLNTVLETFHGFRAMVEHNYTQMLQHMSVTTDLMEKRMLGNISEASAQLKLHISDSSHHLERALNASTERLAQNITSMNSTLTVMLKDINATTTTLLELQAYERWCNERWLQLYVVSALMLVFNLMCCWANFCGLGVRSVSATAQFFMTLSMQRLLWQFIPVWWRPDLQYDLAIILLLQLVLTFLVDYATQRGSPLDPTWLINKVRQDMFDNPDAYTVPHDRILKRNVDKNNTYTAALRQDALLARVAQSNQAKFPGTPPLTRLTNTTGDTIRGIDVYKAQEMDQDYLPTELELLARPLTLNEWLAMKLAARRQPRQLN